MGRPISLGTLIWIVIGLFVAANRGFLGSINDISSALSAILAVVAWPLLLLNIHVAI